MHSAQYWIDKLALQPHPEGGFYRENYRSDSRVSTETPPGGAPRVRTASTAIYFLLNEDDFSAFHRLRSDETWHFYVGGTLVVHVIDDAGQTLEMVLGPDPDKNESFQAVVRAGCWFGSRLKEPNSFALVGCTVAPGFEFEDFELGKRGDLLAQFPQHRELITMLTRE
jgi:predicted cupin superfamily sugar epimerase